MPSFPSSSATILNFVTPINKIFPSPLSSQVFLVLNQNGDLSLYRKSAHIWSAGRFKIILNVDWSPDGKLVLVQCENKIFIYSSEDGRKISTISGAKKIYKWLKIAHFDTLILALIDLESRRIDWSVNCEFEIKGGKLLGIESFDDFNILDAQIDEETFEILILSTSKLLKFKFPFPIHQKCQEETSILQISKVSKQLQILLRLADDLKGQFQKLLKLDDVVHEKLVQIDLNLLRNFLLFGDKKLDRNSHSFFTELTESTVLEWKSKLKKQHAELLVSVEELSSFIRSFQLNFSKFCSDHLDQFLNSELIVLEDQSRLLQHNLAEFLVWLENVIIPDSNTSTNGTTGTNGTAVIKPFKPDSRALEIVKSLQMSNDSKLQRHQNWLTPFDDFKLILDLEFKSLVSKINSIDLQISKQILNIPAGFKKILSTHPLSILGESNDEILLIDKDDEPRSTKLSDKYLGHFNKYKQLRIICKDNTIQSVHDNVIDSKLDFNDQNVFVNPSSDQIFTIPFDNPKKLKCIGYQG